MFVTSKRPKTSLELREDVLCCAVATMKTVEWILDSHGLRSLGEARTHVFASERSDYDD